MEKQNLIEHLRKGRSYNDIATLEKCSKSKVGFWIKKHNIKFESKQNRDYQKNVNHKLFSKIDDINLAYITGFILGDGAIGSNYDIDLGASLSDSSVLESIDAAIPWECRITYDKTLDREARKFPRCRLGIRSRGVGKDLTKHFGGRLKKTRHTPRVSKYLEPYLLAGFFDADGCITWGHRKDRNRVWQKVTFTAPIKILIGIQKILLKYEISTSIRPKSNDISIIEFASKKDVIKFYRMLPNDGIRLKRKVEKFDKLIEVFGLETK